MSEDKIIRFPGQPPQGALVLRVELILRAYPVWRRLRISDRSTFWDLHVAIQDAMGWSHRHRHLFTVGSPLLGKCLRFGIPEQDIYYGHEDVLPSWQHQVCLFAKPAEPPILYTYHLGEQWQHEIMLEAVESESERRPLPACLAGAGTCPLEGLGGAEAFERMLQEAAADWPSLANTDSFKPEDVEFSDPGLRWSEIFGTE